MGTVGRHTKCSFYTLELPYGQTTSSTRTRKSAILGTILERCRGGDR